MGGYTLIGSPSDWIFRWQGSHSGELEGMIDDGRITVSFANIEPSGVPEPSTFVLAGCALAGFGLVALRRRTAR